MNSRIASLSRLPRMQRSTAQRLLRGGALLFLHVILFYVKVLGAVVRFGIGAIERAAAPEKHARVSARPLIRDRTEEPLENRTEELN